MALTLISIITTEEKGLRYMPQNIGIILTASFTALAFISLIPVYKNLRKKWDAD